MTSLHSHKAKARRKSIESDAAKSVYRTPSDARGIFDRASAFFILLILSPVVVWRFLLARKRYGRGFDRIPRQTKSGIQVILYAFAGVESGRDLALLISVLQGRVAWTGASLHPIAKVEKQRQTQIAINGSRRPGIICPSNERERIGVTTNEQNVVPEDASLATSFRHLVQFAVVRLLAPSKVAATPRSFRFLEVDVDNQTLDSALESINTCVLAHSKARFAFINPDCLNKAAQNLSYRAALNSMDRVFADGSGLQLAARHLGVKLRANVNGTDLFPLLCAQSAANGHSIYLLGAAPGIAAQCAENMKNTYPLLKIAGTHDGYFEDDDAVIDIVNATRPDILLVAFGAPKQEQWLARHIENLDVGVAMGVGGLFDFYSGRISRSPVWLRELGMEWIWRLLQEPSRMWRRYLIGNPLFVWRIWRQSKSISGNRIVKRFSNIHARKSLSRRHAVAGMVVRLRIIAARLCRRGMDVVTSSLALLALSPLLASVAVLIKIESRGPMFFTQQRVGKWGVLFKMYKFRSMCLDADIRKADLEDQNEMKNGVIFKMKSDPRITRIGRFIRRYSIDELPQLINVLKGDMSLVGPRPALPSEVAEYSIEDRRRLDIKPGITCLWQVSGRSEIPFDQQVELDVDYIETHGLATDVKILLRTIPAVFAGKGAY